MSTLEKVKKVVVDQLSVDESLVTPEASFTADLGADSLDTVELLMAFEAEFGCEIPDEEAEKIQTVQDAVNYIDAHSQSLNKTNRVCEGEKLNNLIFCPLFIKGKRT